MEYYYIKMPSLSIDEIKTFSKIPTTVFVETGTFYGDTVNEALKHYNKVYSIELSPHYYELAKQRFNSEPRVNLLQGDSSLVLESLCKLLNEPTFFWLDGHFSSGDTAQGLKDCPLVEELKHIVNYCKPGTVIAIDDVRLFGTRKNEDWSTISVDAVVQVVKDRMVSMEFFPSSFHPRDRLVIVLSPM
jgi:predicted O-methyltransferase YrrM